MFAAPAQFHVNQLYLPARESPLHVEVETHEGERERNRFGVVIRVLCGPRVHGVLMNEGVVAMTQGVVLQLLIGSLFSTHRTQRSPPALHGA